MAEPSAVIVDNTLKGYGPIDEPLVVVSGGTLSPGASPGIMVLDDFTLEGGTLEIEIWGPDAGDERDVLQVQGTATFDSGTIEFVFTDATGNVYVPAVGDTFEFLTATTALTGFDDNDQLTLVSIGLDAALDFGVTRTGTALILEISAAELAATRTVPAPGSFVLLLAGLTLLLAARRKYRFPAA